MRRTTILLLVLSIGALGRGAGAQTPDPLGLLPVQLPPALDRVLRDYESAWAAGDGKRLAQLFTEDGFALSNGALPLRGREKIAAWLVRPGGRLQLRAFAWSVSDTVGYIVGGYRYPQTEGPGGKFLLALRKSGDRWLIAADMDNAAGR
ncbi:MAG: YybH family protein [Gemmatimonadaceae bacterium]